MSKSKKDLYKDPFENYEPMAVQVAREVLDMNRELVRMRRENEELEHYKEKYMELLNGSIKHGEKMVGNLLELVMTPGVLEACARANDSKENIND